MSLLKRRQIYFAAALLLIGMGIVLWSGIKDMNAAVSAYSGATTTTELSDSISEFRTLRQQLRAMEKAQLNEVAHDAEADEELVAMAQRQLLQLCEREEQEMTLEGILKLRGWENSVVSVGEDNVNVLLSTEIVTQQESSIILELVCRETGISSGNIKIIPIN